MGQNVKTEEILEVMELVKKKEAAEKALTEDNSLTAEQRRQLLLVIQEASARLGEAEPPKPKGYLGLMVLSFLFPLVGCILCCINLNSQPEKATALGKSALAGLIFTAVLYGVGWLLILFE